MTSEINIVARGEAPSERKRRQDVHRPGRCSDDACRVDVATEIASCAVVDQACADGEADARASSTSALTAIAERGAYAVLRQRLVTMELSPGSPITLEDAVTIADGRIDHVRGALDHLVDDGLLTAPDRCRRYVVTPLDPGDIAQAVELRGVLLAAAATNRAARGTDSRVLAAAGGGAGIAAAGDASQVVNAHRLFAVSVAASTGNERLRRLMERTVAALERPFMVLARTRPEVLTRWPHALAREIGGGKVERVRALCEAEILELRDATLCAVSERTSETRRS